MLRRMFVDHPAAVGESYLEHLRVALSFARELLTAGFACLVHGFVPCLFERTGSASVTRLHRRMVENRDAASRTAAVAATHAPNGRGSG